MQKLNREKMKSVLIMLLLLGVWLLFFMNKYFIFETSDIAPHYEFALRLRELKTLGLKRFVMEVNYAHIISYPAWHIFFLLFLSIIKGIVGLLHITSISEDTVYLITQALENSFLLIATFLLVEKIFQKEKITPFAAMCMMFAGPLFYKGINTSYYLGQLTPNPWHNPTTFIVRPLAIISFFLYLSMLKKRAAWDSEINREKNRREECRYFIIFSMLLLVSAICKPNWYQVFVPALFLFCIVDLILTKGKSFLFCVKTGFAVLPVCVWAMIQFWMSFGLHEGGGMYAAWLKVWTGYSPHIWGSILLSLAFPVYVFILCYKEIFRKKEMLLCLILQGSSMGQFAILCQTARGGGTGDFVWGCYLSVFIMFMVAIMTLCDYRKQNGKNWKYYLGLGIFGLHVFLGGLYFIRIYEVGTFLL